MILSPVPRPRPCPLPPPLTRPAPLGSVNDRVLSANGVSLEHVDYTTAVQVLKDSGAVVRLYVKRRVVLPAQPEPQTLKVSLAKTKKKDGKWFSLIVLCRAPSPPPPPSEPHVTVIRARSAS